MSPENPDWTPEVERLRRDLARAHEGTDLIEQLTERLEITNLTATQREFLDPPRIALKEHLNKNVQAARRALHATQVAKEKAKRKAMDIKTRKEVAKKNQ